MAKYKLITEKGKVEDLIEGAVSEFSSLRDEIEEWKGNMEGTALENTDKYSRLEEACEILEGIVDKGESLEIDSLPEALRETEVSYSQSIVRSKRQHASRATRAENALNMLRAVVSEVEDLLKKGEGEEISEEDIGSIQSFKSDLEEVISDAESVEFPGMFG